MVRSDLKKIQKIRTALQELKEQIEGEAKGAKLSGDKFEKKKQELAIMDDKLEKGTSNIVMLGEKGKDVRNLIEAKHKLRVDFANADKLMKEFEVIIKKEGEGGSAKNVLLDKSGNPVLKEDGTPKTKGDRAMEGQKYVKIFLDKLKTYCRQAREVNLELRDDTDNDTGESGRTARQQRLEKQRQKRLKTKQRKNGGNEEEEDDGKKGKKGKKGGAGGGGGGGDDAYEVTDEIEMKGFGESGGVQKQSMAEQEFMAEVERCRREEDEMLEEIAKALDSLNELATTLNKQLKTTTVLLAVAEKQMDDTQEQFDKANARLSEMLEESGGLSRWCPFIICAMVILALVGYMFKFF